MPTSLMFWNLFEAGLEVVAGDERRWQEQVAVVGRHRPDILCITEGWQWHEQDQALFERAREEFGYDHGELYVAKSGCHMAIFWNAPVELVRFDRQPHDQAWWHGFYRATLRIPGMTDLFTVVGSHMNPFDPTLRRIEGSWLRVALPAATHGVIVMDANTVAPGDPEPEYALNSHQIGAELADRSAVEILAAAGLVDAAVRFDDRRPTVGHFAELSPGAVGREMRIDQVWATPSVDLQSYRVIDDLTLDPELDHASDHRPVWIEFV